jgi:hypothetical protein
MVRINEVLIKNFATIKSPFCHLGENFNGVYRLLRRFDFFHLLIAQAVELPLKSIYSQEQYRIHLAIVQDQLSGISHNKMAENLSHNN